MRSEYSTASVTGLHHVTVIAGDAQENLDFYVGVLGMRLVKRSVNQDAPGTYHLFYADAAGNPGTDLTFFPWAEMAPGRKGIGLTVEVALAIPAGALPYWMERLGGHGVVTEGPSVRFGEQALTFTDPHGLSLALIETADIREFAPWAESSVPPEWQIRGLHAVRLLERDLGATRRFLADGLGFTAAGEEAGWHRFVVGDGGSGCMLDLQERPSAPRGTWGVGSVHHVAWRVPDIETEIAVRERIRTAGRQPTDVIDRFWFQSVYFKEPGGALFEIATDGPGFAVDESAETLGERLVLPPWLEPQREVIEAALPAIRLPRGD